MRRMSVLVALATVALGGSVYGQSAAPTVAAPAMVFFDWGKAEVSGDAAAILDGILADYRKDPGRRILLAGFSDRSGQEGSNLRSSQHRADAVRGYLVAHGVADGAISTSAFGELKPLVDTEDGVREPQNRRVEITFGPASGM